MRNSLSTRAFASWDCSSNSDESITVKSTETVLDAVMGNVISHASSVLSIGFVSSVHNVQILSHRLRTFPYRRARLKGGNHRRPFLSPSQG